MLRITTEINGVRATHIAFTSKEKAELKAKYSFLQIIAVVEYK